MEICNNDDCTITMITADTALELTKIYYKIKEKEDTFNYHTNKEDVLETYTFFNNKINVDNDCEEEEDDEVTDW